MYSLAVLKARCNPACVKKSYFNLIVCLFVREVRQADLYYTVIFNINPAPEGNIRRYQLMPVPLHVRHPFL